MELMSKAERRAYVRGLDAAIRRAEALFEIEALDGASKVTLLSLIHQLKEEKTT